MKKDILLAMIDILKEYKTISVKELVFKMEDIPKRRIFDVLPILAAIGMIDRSVRGKITWIRGLDDPVERDGDIIYNGKIIEVSAAGVITSVKRFGVQHITIEQTAEGFSVKETEPQ